MHSSDDKIVSISFDNKKFLDEVQNTIKALEQLNDAASGKHLNTSGLETAFNNLSRSATSNIDSINKTIQDTSSYATLSKSVNDTGKEFSALEVVAVGALLSIGNAAMGLGAQIASNLTRGIRDGWQEYNLLVDSTQTILANTERYGTTINDVTKSLDELNDYADLTIYNFAQMTRNMGYFTTSGMDLDAAQNMVIGMANTAALFGTANEQLQRAMYQMSQAMSAGTIRKMDWKSMQNASMGGMLLQEELIRTAALMTGKPFEEMNEWVSRMGGFYESLEQGWLTSEIFQETMRRFAGMTREEAAAIRDLNGNPLSDEEIDRIVELGEKGLEAAQVVRTLHQMLEAVGESIGSGWAQSFRIIIGDLEQAKKFWSPINKIITENISAVGNYRNAIIQAWADMYRPKMLDDMNEAIRNIDAVLEAIGTGITRAFGDPKTIGQNIGRITEAFGDLSASLKLDEEELQDVADLFEGLAAPFRLIGDIIYEFSMAFFNAGQTMDIFATRTDSTIDKLKPFRKALLNIVGAFGRYLSMAVRIIEATGLIHKSFTILFKLLKTSATIIGGAFNIIFNSLNSLWNKYDMTNKLLNFTTIAFNELMKLKNAFISLGGELKVFLSTALQGLLSLDLDPIEDLFIILRGLKDLLADIIDPTISLNEAFNKFKQTLKSTTIYNALVYIKDIFLELVTIIKQSELGPYIEAIGNIADKVFTVIKYSLGAIIIAITKLKNLIMSTDVGDIINKIGKAFVVVYNKLKSTRFGDFLVNITDDISEALHNLSVIFRGNKVTSDAVSFINGIKDALTIEHGTLPKNNIFTFVSDISKDVNDAAGKLSNSNAFRIVKDVINQFGVVSKEATSIIKGIDDDGADPDKISRVSLVFYKIMDALSWLGEKLSSIGAYVFKKIKAGFEWFSNTLSFMASGERYRDLDSAQRFADIVEMFVRVFSRISTSVLAFITALSVFRWATAVSSIGEGIESMGDALKQMFAAKKWASIASIFKTIAIFAVILMVGISLISKFVNIKKFYAVLMLITSAISELLIGVTILVSVVMGFSLLIAKSSKKLGLETAKTIGAVSRIFKSISKVLTSIILFVVAISIIAIKVDSMGDPTIFFDAINAMMTLFIVISAVLSVMALVIVGLSKRLSLLDQASNNLITDAAIQSPLEQVLGVFKVITSSIISIILSLGASLALMMHFAKDVDTLKMALKWFTIIISVVMATVVGIMAAIILFGNKVNIGGALAINGATGQIMLCIAKITFAISLLVTVLSVSFSMISMSIASLGSILNLIGPEATEELNSILVGLGIFIAALFAGFIYLTKISANAPPLNELGSRMLAISSAMLIMAVSLGIISASIAVLVDKTKSISWKRLTFVFFILSGMFALVGSALALIGVVCNNTPNLNMNKMLGIAASFDLLSLSLTIISSSIIAIAALPLDKMNEASQNLFNVFILLGVVLAGLSLLSSTGIGTAGIIVAAASMLAMSVSILAIGSAMLQAAKGIKVYAQALQIIQNLNAAKIRENIGEVAKTLPDMLKMILANIGNIEKTIVGMGQILGTAIATSIFTALETFHTLLIAGGSTFITTISDIIIGILYGILISIKNFVKLLTGRGSVLWEILEMLGGFLVDASEYAGYYGTLIIVKLFEGIIHAIMDLGWDIYITSAINTVWTSVKNWWEENISHWLERQINNIVTAVRVAQNAADIEGAQNEITELNEEINEFTSSHSRDQYGRYIGSAADESNLLWSEGSTTANEHYRQLLDRRSELQRELNGYYQSQNDIWSIYDSVNGQINEEIEDTVANNNQISSIFDEMLEQEMEARHILNNAPGLSGSSDDYTGYNTYIPDNYRGQAMDHRRATDTIAGGIRNLGDVLRDFLGLSNGQSIGDMLSDVLGFSNEGDGIFSSFGIQAGDDYMSGLSESLSTGDLTASSIIKPPDSSDIDYSGFTNALENATNLPEEASNPVISPVLETDKFWSDFDMFEKTWNNRTYDEFAVDVGTSMMVREQADGDAVTDGSVSYNFTQNNYSNRDLTRTEIYRDGHNLLRGSGLFRAT